MKKLFVSISGLLTYSFLAVPAFAADASINPCKDATGLAATLCGLGGPEGGSISKTIQNIVVFFIVLAVIIALLYLLYGGIKWIMSKGEKTEVESARNHIMAAVIGLIVVFMAVFIVTIILAAFGVKFTELAIPTIGGNAYTQCVDACKAADTGIDACIGACQK